MTRIELGRLLDRQIGRFRSPQNLVNEFGSAPEEIEDTWTIGYETTRFGVLPNSMHCRQPDAAVLM
jgi:hypothetical protein